MMGRSGKMISVTPSFLLLVAALSAITIAVLTSAPGAMANPSSAAEYNVSSPDNNVRVSFTLENGRPYYSVSYKNRAIVENSSLGFHFENASPLDGDFVIVDTTLESVDNTWEPVWGATDNVRDHYNQLTVRLKENVDPHRYLILEFRAYNDGVGYRYILPEQENLRDFAITSEDTQFRFTGDYTAWWIPADYDSYEKLYNETPLSELTAANTPVTIKVDDELYVSVHEADLTDYADMTLASVENEPYTFESALVPLPASGVKVIASTPHSTPWRTMIIGTEPGDLIESNLILNLNDPSAIENTSWIKPGKYMGIWWELHIGKSTWENGPNHGATTANAKRYIDFASEHGIPYLLVEGWNKGWEGSWDDQDFTTSYDDYDLEEVVRYAREHGVEIIAHIETGANVQNFMAQIDEAFSLYENLGIPAVKTGYVGSIPNHYHHDQWMVNHYLEVIKKAAEHRLMIDVHEPIKPTGLQRTYPNLMTCEGVRGTEYDAWSSGNPPEHTVIIPFTRMLAGPLDYTPGIFDIMFEGTNPDYRVHTTRARQLAYYPVLLSGLQMVADLPEHYENAPEFEFIERVPASWDETKVLNGKIGDYITVARRSGDEWFVGSLTDEEARELEVPLNFLGPGKYVARIYSDAPETDVTTNPTPVTIENRIVDSSDTIIASMKSAGGQAIWITPAPPTVENRVVPIIDGSKDLNKNGVIDPYENWMLPVDNRVEDLLSRMTLEEKVGEMFHPHFKEGVDMPQSGEVDVARAEEFILNLHITHFLNNGWAPPANWARWSNQIQEIAENSRLGIPVIFSRDPAWVSGGWLKPLGFGGTQPLGFAATWDPEIVRRYGMAMAREYRAVGLHEALDPLADIATEPRWIRVYETFGENADLVAEMVDAYIRGFQGEELNEDSVICVTKHFPGGGPQEDGYDPHDQVGENQVYPGNNLDYHLIPFKVAIEAGTGAILPYFAIPRAIDNVGANYSRATLTDLLRENLGYEGLILSDWDVNWRPWGVAELLGREPTPEDMARLMLNAGIDQFGMTRFSETVEWVFIVLGLVNNGEVSENRIDNSVRLILKNKFKLGLFEDPYVDPDYAENIVGHEDHIETTREAQRKSIVLLKNDGILPLLERENPRVYVTGMGSGAISEYAEVVDRPEDADAAVIKIKPSLSEADLALLPSTLDRIKAVVNTGTPTIVVIEMGRPPIIPWIAGNASGILATFGVSDDVLADVLFGHYSPSGKLPYELPSSMEAVRNQLEDVPYDTNDPLYPYGFGLLYPLTDLRVPPYVESLYESVPISVVANNSENAWVTRTVELYIDESLVDSEEVTLAPYGSEEVTFTYRFTESGVHVIRVGWLEATVGVNIPGTFEYSNLKVTSGLGTSSITASARVKNIGGREGTENVKLYVDGEVVASRSITLGSDETSTVSFPYEFKNSGAYWVKIGSLEPERVEILGGLSLAGKNEVLHLGFDYKYQAGYDSSGRGNNGTISGNPQWVEGKFGNALSFDGEDDYASVLHSTSLAPPGGLAELSVGAWVYVDGTIPTGQGYAIAGKYDWGTTGWLIKTERRTSAAGNFSFVVYVACANGGYWGLAIDDAAPVSQWVYIAFTYNGSTNALTMYINGQNRNADKNQWASGSGGNVPSSTGNLFIGSEGGSFSFFKGIIDEVRILDRVPTESEIQALYHWNVSYRGRGTHTTEWRDLGGNVSWSSLEAATYISENTGITATVQVSTDGSTIANSLSYSLLDGRHSYPLGLEGRYVRIKTALITENSLRSPMLDWYALTGDGVRGVWSTLPEWEAGERENLITGLLNLPSRAEAKAEFSYWWLLAAGVGVLVVAILGRRYLLMLVGWGGRKRGWHSEEANQQKSEGYIHRK